MATDRAGSRAVAMSLPARRLCGRLVDTLAYRNWILRLAAFGSSMGNSMVLNSLSLPRSYRHCHARGTHPLSIGLYDVIRNRVETTTMLFMYREPVARDHSLAALSFRDPQRVVAPSFGRVAHPRWVSIAPDL